MSAATFHIGFGGTPGLRFAARITEEDLHNRRASEREASGIVPISIAGNGAAVAVTAWIVAGDGELIVELK